MNLPPIEPIVWGKQKSPEPKPVITAIDTGVPPPKGKDCYSTFSASEEAAMLKEVCKQLEEVGISFSLSGGEIFCSPADMPTTEKIFRAVLYAK